MPVRSNASLAAKTVLQPTLATLHSQQKKQVLFFADWAYLAFNGPTREAHACIKRARKAALPSRYCQSAATIRARCFRRAGKQWVLACAQPGPSDSLNERGQPAGGREAVRCTTTGQPLILSTQTIGQLECRIGRETGRSIRCASTSWNIQCRKRHPCRCF